jgi:hypothetical protein
VGNLNLNFKLVGQLRIPAPAVNTVVIQSALGDYNRDGVTDIAVTGMDPSGATNDLRILFGGKGGELKDGTSVLGNAVASYQTSNILSVDFNHDGYTDLVIGRSGGDMDTTDGLYADTQLVYLSKGDGTYRAVESNGRLYAHNVMISDVNNDGYADAFFLATGEGPSLLMLNQLGTGGTLQFTTTGLPEKAMKSGTGESWDVLEYYPNGALKVMRGWHQHNTAFNDVNRDGKLDMVMFFAGSTEGLIYLNSGSNIPRFDLSAPLKFNAVLDGLPSKGYTLYGILKSDGNWAGLRVVKQGTNYYETIQYDVNGDGWEDVLAVATGENKDFTDLGSGWQFEPGTDGFNKGTFYQVLINSGQGLADETSQRITQPSASRESNYHYGHYTMFSLIDLNGDGAFDFTSNQNSGVRFGAANSEDESDTIFMLNSGNGVFKQVSILGLEFGSFHPFPVDGKLGFVAMVPPTAKDWSEKGAPPRPQWDFLVFSSSVPWTIGDDQDNFLYGTPANDLIVGGAGVDTFQPLGRRDQFTVSLDSGTIVLTDKQGLKGVDRLSQVERIGFYDQNVAFDIGGSAGQAFRVYKAAFNRDPTKGDTVGLGYWIAQMDSGMNVVEVAARFIDSSEFRALYGSNPTNAEFLSRVYTNVLGRTPDSSGYDWWLNEMNTNLEKTKAKVLADFAESAENKEGVLGLIGNGIAFDPWGP